MGNKTAMKVSGGVLAGFLVLGGGAVALAQATPERPVIVGQAPVVTVGQAPVATVADEATDHPGRGRGLARARAAKAQHLMRRAITGTLTVKDADGNYVQVSFGRGVVKEVSESAIVLELDNGDLFEATIDGDTIFRGADSAAEVTVGQQAMVITDADGSARSVNQPGGAGKADPDEPGKGRGRGPTGTPGATAPGRQGD
jgi:hypothetical protein